MSLVFALERFDERNKSQHKSDLDEQAVQVTPKICQSVEVHTLTAVKHFASWTERTRLLQLQ